MSIMDHSSRKSASYDSQIHEWILNPHAQTCLLEHPIYMFATAFIHLYSRFLFCWLVLRRVNLLSSCPILDIFPTWKARNVPQSNFIFRPQTGCCTLWRSNSKSQWLTSWYESGHTTHNTWTYLCEFLFLVDNSFTLLPLPSMVIDTAMFSPG